MSDRSSGNRRAYWTPTMLLVLATVMGLIARTWVVLHAPKLSYAVDELFDTLAWNLVSRHQFTLDGMNPAAHVGPLYPALLASVYSVVGHRPEWVPLLHIVFDMTTALCVYRVGVSLWGAWTGACAAALFFLYPAYWTYDPRIRSEALLTLLVSGWLWAAVACVRSQSIRQYVVTGVLAGLAVLCKPVVLILAIVLAALVLIGTLSLPQKMACVGAYVVACLVVVLPWSVRNYFVFHEAIPVSAGMGAGLWMGSDPVSRGSWPMPRQRESAIWESAGITPLPYAHAMYDVQTDRLLREKGWSRIQSDPLTYVELTLTRVWDFWVGNSFYLVSSEDGFVRAFQQDAVDRGWSVAGYSLLKRLLFIPCLIVMALWSAWGERERWRELLPLFLFPIGLTAGYVPFTVEAGRYALPVLPCLMVLSVALIVRLLKARSLLASGQSYPHEASVSWRTS